MTTQYSAEYLGPVDVLVVGAGLAGLAAGRDLLRAGLTVHLLDKSRGVSGRAATRWLELDGKTFRVDHGAQYFTARGDALRMILPDLVGRGIVREWTQGFPTLSEKGIKPRVSRHPRYICPEGMSALGKAFLQGSEVGEEPLLVETKAPVKELRRVREGWEAVLEGGETRLGLSLLVNMPAPQALSLTEAVLEPEVRAALEAVRFAPCWAVILVPESLPYLDWEGLEIEHPVLSWAALDHTKREVKEPPVLVLHASPEWSQEHLELTPEEVLPLVLGAAEELLGGWVTKTRLALAHRWRYAMPTRPHPWPFLAQDNLVFCGDWCGGAKIEAALESGW
ncbi:MAG: FAD-binding dehydrogenase, partial [Meiothermus sp.]